MKTFDADLVASHQPRSRASGAAQDERCASEAPHRGGAEVAATLAPELLWTGDRFEAGRTIELRRDGTIGRVGRVEEGAAGLTRLSRRALLPGFVNAHSHAFQRGLRGRGEEYPAGAGSFWSWREAMYALVEELDAERLHALSLGCFREMLAAGITTVGEFHYVHRGRDGRWAELDEAVVRAAREAPIRLVLLQAAYRTGGIGEPLRGGQRRFDTAGLDEYWTHFDELARGLDPTRETLGVVAHSVRAVPWSEVVALRAESRRRGLVFHMHVEEVVPEIKAAEAAYGRRPMQMVVEDLEVDERFAAVHCTHTAPADMERYLDAGGAVVLCPLTEGNLGDGVPDLPAILARGGRVAVGSDLNSRLCVFEELRWVEYVQRLLRRERGTCRDGRGEVAPRLLEMATVNGARALGVNTGVLAAGGAADLVSIDLDAPTLEGWTPETLAASLVFGAGNGVIDQVWVGGRKVDRLRG